MRTIKFRGYSKDFTENEWFFGNLIDKGNGSFQILEKDPKIWDLSYDGITVFPESIGQFTGLYDKNGKEIYEGDIVKYFNTKDCLEYYITVVKWGYKSSGFTLKCDTRKYTKFGTIKYYSIPNSKYIEIIGNIYENPELLTD